MDATPVTTSVVEAADVAPPGAAPVAAPAVGTGPDPVGAVGVVGVGVDVTGTLLDDGTVDDAVTSVVSVVGGIEVSGGWSCLIYRRRCWLRM